MSEKECPVCHELFSEEKRGRWKGRYRKYCSPNCSLIANGKIAVYVTKICPVCEQQFESNKKTQKCCSAKCTKKKHYKANHAKYLERESRYRAADPKKYYDRGRMRQVKFAAEIYAYNNARRRKLRWTHPWRLPLDAAKQRSKLKNIAYNLTEDWAKARWTGRCEISNISFNAQRNGAGPRMYAPSLDRIDSTKGYTQDNCRFILTCINTFRGVGTDHDILRISQAIVSNAHRGLRLDLPERNLNTEAAVFQIEDDNTRPSGH